MTKFFFKLKKNIFGLFLVHFINFIFLEKLWLCYTQRQKDF